MPDQIQQSVRFTDLSPRMVFSTTVVASPAGASETIIASVTIPSALLVATGVVLNGWAAYTIGATPTSAQLRIRQTSVAGTIKADTGAMTGGHNTAGFLVADDVNGVDTAPADAQIYKLTLTVAGGSSASTVSAVFLQATVI